MVQMDIVFVLEVHSQGVFIEFGKHSTLHVIMGETSASIIQYERLVSMSLVFLFHSPFSPVD
jgi:hypothetical protein